MNKKKSFDCVEFKNKLQENAWKNSGAKTLREYVDCANNLALKSPLNRINNDKK
ncbi:MAG: hypothetical protein LBM96_04575 [Methanobrevibacter sp.]|jgi:hypothetical protein|nr:hypothetical protein [Candidatus Methanoflexus mossambicus]